MSNIYSEIYNTEDYYWGVRPSKSCFKVLELMPPIRSLHVLDIGCGDGQNAVFLSRNGYTVDAIDGDKDHVAKTAALAEASGVKLKVFAADIQGFKLTEYYDILFSSRGLHFLSPEIRKERFANYRLFTNENGIHMFSVVVEKPFLGPVPDSERVMHTWRSGELLGHYADWLVEYCSEDVFDCNVEGVVHQHAIDRVLSRNVSWPEHN